MLDLHFADDADLRDDELEDVIQVQLDVEIGHRLKQLSAGKLDEAIVAKIGFQNIGNRHQAKLPDLDGGDVDAHFQYELVPLEVDLQRGERIGIVKFHFACLHNVEFTVDRAPEPAPGTIAAKGRFYSGSRMDHIQNPTCLKKPLASVGE